jgi:hypothetical protein
MRHNCAQKLTRKPGFVFSSVCLRALTRGGNVDLLVGPIFSLVAKGREGFQELDRVATLATWRAHLE